MLMDFLERFKWLAEGGIEGVEARLEKWGFYKKVYIWGEQEHMSSPQQYFRRPLLVYSANMMCQRATYQKQSGCRQYNSSISYSFKIQKRWFHKTFAEKGSRKFSRTTNKSEKTNLEASLSQSTQFSQRKLEKTPDFPGKYFEGRSLVPGISHLSKPFTAERKKRNYCQVVAKDGKIDYVIYSLGSETNPFT